MLCFEVIVIIIMIETPNTRDPTWTQMGYHNSDRNKKKTVRNDQKKFYVCILQRYTNRGSTK